MITESGWSKETTEGIFLLVYLQSSLRHKVKVPEYLARLLPSAGARALVHKYSPQHPFGMLALFAKLTFISFYFLLQTH